MALFFTINGHKRTQAGNKVANKQPRANCSGGLPGVS
jgi:hypothetical protein